MQLKGTVKELRATFISLLPRLSRLHSEKRHGEWNFGSTQPYEGQGAIQSRVGDNIVLSGRFGDLTIYGNNAEEINWETIAWAFTVCGVEATFNGAGLCIEQPGWTQRLCACLLPPACSSDSDCSAGVSCTGGMCQEFCGSCILGGCGKYWDAQWPYTAAQCAADGGNFIECLSDTAPWPCGVDYSEYPQSFWERVEGCDGECNGFCLDDSECPSGYFCHGAESCCLPIPGDNGEHEACTSDSDCSGGLSCCGDVGSKICVRDASIGTCFTSSDFCGTGHICAEGISECNCTGSTKTFIEGSYACDDYTTEGWRTIFGCEKGCCIIAPGGNLCAARVRSNISADDCAAKCASGDCKAFHYPAMIDPCVCLSQLDHIIDACTCTDTCTSDSDCDSGFSCVPGVGTNKCCVEDADCNPLGLAASVPAAPSTINVTVEWKYTSGTHMAPGHIAGSTNEDWNSLFWWYPTTNVGSTWIAALTAGSSFAHANFYNQDNGSCSETCSPSDSFSCDCDSEVCKTVTWTDGDNDRIGKYGDIALSGYSNTDSVGYGTITAVYSFTKDAGNSVEDIYTIKDNTVDIPHFHNEFSTTTLTKKCCNRNCFRKCSCKDVAEDCSSEKSKYSDTQYWRQGKPVATKLAVPFNSAILKRKRVSGDENKWEYDINIEGIVNGSCYNMTLNSDATASGGSLTTVFPDSIKHHNDAYNSGYYSSKNYCQYCGKQPRTKDLTSTAWKPLSFTLPSPYNTDTSSKVTTWGTNSAAVLATAEQGKGYLWTPTTGQIDSHKATVTIAEVT